MGLAASDIDAVFITHEHGDHVGCALTLARRHRIPLWTSRGTWRAIGEPDIPDGLLHFARDLATIAIGDLELSPYTVPHDANEPLQLRVGDGAVRLGVLTDVGSITAHLLAQLQGCDALLLECNHDRAMLANSSYPASLKARIGRPPRPPGKRHRGRDPRGLHARGLNRLVAAHLSERTTRRRWHAPLGAGVGWRLRTSSSPISATASAGSTWRTPSVSRGQNEKAARRRLFEAQRDPKISR
jgi:phosphoribosyl 1,2-cyclic phosphodiesterase